MKRRLKRDLRCTMTPAKAALKKYGLLSMDCWKRVALNGVRTLRS